MHGRRIVTLLQRLAEVLGGAAAAATAAAKSLNDIADCGIVVLLK
jgi:hypothetical protein